MFLLLVWNGYGSFMEKRKHCWRFLSLLLWIISVYCFILFRHLKGFLFRILLSLWMRKFVLTNPTAVHHSCKLVCTFRLWNIHSSRAWKSSLRHFFFSFLSPCYAKYLILRGFSYDILISKQNKQRAIYAILLNVPRGIKKGIRLQKKKTKPRVFFFLDPVRVLFI